MSHAADDSTVSELDSSNYLTEEERKNRFFVETVTLAALLACGDDLIDRARPHLRLSDFDGTHRIMCKVILMCRDQGASMEHRFIEAMFYPEERAAEIRHILKTYESIRDSPTKPTGEHALTVLRKNLDRLRREVTALYFWRDASGILLYVGITNDLSARQTNHAKKSSWSEFADTCKVQRFASRIEAERAERAAIEAERPLFNHQHNDSPEARQRLVNYLIKHGRTDLLAPAVSRG